MTQEDDMQGSVDELEDDLDIGQDFQDYQNDSYEVSSIPNVGSKSEGLYDWFWKVVKLNKPGRVVRVGNLSHQEIGEVKVSVREALNLAHLGKTFHHPTFGNYFANLARITSATSMAKKGWFMDLTISQKRVRERSRTSNSSADVTSENKGWRMFKRKK